jgi:hypothetical protein
MPRKVRRNENVEEAKVSEVELESELELELEEDANNEVELDINKEVDELVNDKTDSLMVKEEVNMLESLQSQVAELVNKKADMEEVDLEDVIPEVFEGFWSKLKLGDKQINMLMKLENSMTVVFDGVSNGGDGETWVRKIMKRVMVHTKDGYVLAYFIWKFLVGKALQWFMSLDTSIQSEGIEITKMICRKWPTPKRAQSELYQMLFLRKQKEKESVRAVALDLQQIFSKIKIDDKKYADKLLNNLLIGAVKKELKEKYLFLHGYNVEHKTFEDLTDELVRIEKVYYGNSQKPVEEVTSEESAEVKINVVKKREREEMNDIPFNNVQPTSFIMRDPYGRHIPKGTGRRFEGCWRCGMPGHMQYECRDLPRSQVRKRFRVDRVGHEGRQQIPRYE